MCGYTEPCVACRSNGTLTTSSVTAAVSTALKLRQTLDQRFAECGLVLHPEKTKVVYCKDAHRKGEHATIQFDFLGYTFRPRLAKWQEGCMAYPFCLQRARKL